jgi:hypothetical protein
MSDVRVSDAQKDPNVVHPTYNGKSYALKNV